MKDWYGLAAVEVVVLVVVVWLLLRHPRWLLAAAVGALGFVSALVLVMWTFALELAGLGGGDGD